MIQPLFFVLQRLRTKIMLLAHLFIVDLLTLRHRVDSIIVLYAGFFSNIKNSIGKVFLLGQKKTRQLDGISYCKQRKHEPLEKFYRFNQGKYSR